MEDNQDKQVYNSQGSGIPMTAQTGFESNTSNQMQYDWIDVVRQQNSRLVQNEERVKQQDQIRKQKYRQILEQEMNEKQAQKKQINDIKKKEQVNLEQSIKIVDKYDEEKKIQKKNVEREIQEQNRQLILNKKAQEKEDKYKQIEQSLNSYTQQNLNIQRDIDDQNNQKIQKQKDFLNQLENIKKTNQDIKQAKKESNALEEQSHLNQLSIDEQQRRNDRDKIRYGYQAEKPTVYQQINNAYKEKEQRQKYFEDNYINNGQQELIQREKKMQEFMKQGKKQLQQQVDTIVGDQLEWKKQSQISEQNHRNEERNQADKNFINFKNAEKQRKLNQRELFQRQNIINEQQQQLKGQIKERQRHMNDNEIRINIENLPESPVKTKNSSQLQNNKIYMSDYVSYDRQKQLKHLDKDLTEVSPYQKDQYNRMIANNQNTSVLSNKDPNIIMFPQPNSPQPTTNQYSNRSNSNLNFENNLYLQQSKFPRHHGFTNNQSLLGMSPNQKQEIENKMKNEFQQYQINSNRQSTQQQILQNQNNMKQFNQIQYEQQYRQNSQDQIQNNYISPKQQENYSNQQSQKIQNNDIPQQQDYNRNVQPLQGFSNTINTNNKKVQQLQGQQYFKSHSQTQITNRDTSPINKYNNTNTNPSNQLLTPNNFYQQFNQNVQNKNYPQNQNMPPSIPLNNMPQSPVVSDQNMRRRNSNKEFKIKSIQYNNGLQNYSSRISTDEKVYNNPQYSNQQKYHLSKVNNYPSQQNLLQNNGNTFNNGYSGQNSSNLHNSSINYIESRQNMVSSQRQDYAQIRQNNANWAKRGFNIITGV